MIRVYLDKLDYAQETRVVIVDERDDGKRLYAKPVTLEFADNMEGLPIEPTLKFGGRHGQNFLQALVDAICEAGYRPNVTERDRSELAATRAHLEREKLISDKIFAMLDSNIELAMLPPLERRAKN